MKSFRAWLEEVWRQNCDEHDAWGEPRLSMSQYFQMYKWWLKREYKYRYKNNLL